LLGIAQAEALAIGLEDMDPMGETIQQGPSQSFIAQHLGPVFKGQIGGHDQAGAFVSPADDLEEEFGTGLGKGHVSKLIENQQMLLFQSLQKTL
jgi:hypothetical protein